MDFGQYGANGAIAARRPLFQIV